MERFRNVCLWVIRIGLWIVPFIPLYVSSRLFFPYITGKAFIFRTIVEVVFVAWVCLMLVFREARLKWKPLTVAVAIFVGVVALATAFGANPYRSFWSNYERMEGLVTHLHLFAYFLVLTHVFRPKDWAVFWNLFLVSGVVQNGYALFQKLGYLKSPQGGFRVDGTIGNPTYVAAYLVFVLAIALLLLFQAKGRWLRVWYGFVAAFSLLTIYFTATRGVILALFVGAIASGVYYLVRVRAETSRAKLAKRIVSGCLVLLVLAAVGIKVFRQSPIVKQSEILSRLSSISLKEGTSRFLIWNMGFQGFKERPILGWGPENYNIIFAKYYSPKLYTQEPWFDRSHNIVFDWLISAGILGLASYLGMFITAVYILWRGARAARAERTAFLFSGLFFVYFVQNLFVFDQLATYLAVFAVLAYIGGGAWRGTAMLQRTETASVLAWWRPTAAAGVGISLAFAWFAVVEKPLAANLRLIEAMRFGSAGELERSLAAFNGAFSYRTFGRSEITEQFAQFTISVVGSERVDAEVKQKVFDRAIRALRENIIVNPGDPRPHLFLGAVERSGGLLDDASATFREAIRLSPTKQLIYFELADVHIRKGDYVKAVEVLETAFTLEPRFDEARKNLVAAHILNDEQDKADQLLKDGYGTVDIAEGVLAQVYTVKKNYVRLIGVWAAFVARNPKSIDYRKNLAAAYLAAGRATEAIQVLEAAIQMNPEFKEEGESYIREIRAGGRP